MRNRTWVRFQQYIPVNWNFNLNCKVNFFYFFSFNNNHLLYFLLATTRFYFMFSFNDNLYFSYIPTTLTVPMKWDCHRSCKWDFNRTRSFFGLHAFRESCDFDTVCPFVCPFLSQDWLIRFFWNFVWSWGSVSTEKWQSRIFWKNSGCPINGPKRPKIARFDIFLYFSQDFFIRFFWYFAWSWGLIST